MGLLTKYRSLCLLFILSLTKMPCFLAFQFLLMILHYQPAKGLRLSIFLLCEPVAVLSLSSSTANRLDALKSWRYLIIKQYVYHASYKNTTQCEDAKRHMEVAAYTMMVFANSRWISRWIKEPHSDDSGVRLGGVSYGWLKTQENGFGISVSPEKKWSYPSLYLHNGHTYSSLWKLTSWYINMQAECWVP